MRALFGFMQIGLGIGGFVALFNGQWLVMILCWVGGFLVGWLGNHVVRVMMGVSQAGQDAMGNLPRALEQISSGNYVAAEGTSLGAVNAFRMGGDRAFLPMALTLRAVALGANGKFDQARAAVNEAEVLSRGGSQQLQEIQAEIRPLILVVQSELRTPVPDSQRLVKRFLELNDE